MYIWFTWLILNLAFLEADNVNVELWSRCCLCGTRTNLVVLPVVLQAALFSITSLGGDN